MIKYMLICCALIFTGSKAEAMIFANNNFTINSFTTGGLTETEKVEHLIQYIHTLKGATFIRNGSEHSCKEAADHLRSKWEKHRSKIRTAENFVEKLASESGMSGEAYKIKFADGKVVTTNEVLMRELRRIEGR